MKLATLLSGVVCMLVMLQSELNMGAWARTQLPTQDTCHKCALLDINKKDQEFTMEVINTRLVHSEGDTLAKFKDHANIQLEKSKRRVLSQKHVFEGKKGRWLAVDEVDYAGPRTHPPTKPPRKIN